AYGEPIIFERHRHRYEFNNACRRRAEAAGLLVSGRSADNNLVEIVELRDHPWYVATQFHPEFKSRPTRPHPLFRGFLAAAVRRAEEQGVDRIDPTAETTSAGATPSQSGRNGHVAESARPHGRQG
ncbi:MAG: glutamine amidotransferase-related protein, partial [Ktedonobacterales bacterium]